jgi:glycosyltransferase involved in cell wall biosynthesis
MVNMNHFQRVYFLSRQAHLTVFARKDSDFSSSAAAGAEIVRAPCNGKWGVALACFFWMIVKGRSAHYDVVLTEPSKLCICGLLGKAILGVKWVVDVWDIPFRCGSKAARPWRRCISRVDRIVARFLFRFADYFILSILPEVEFAEFGVPQAKMLLLKNAIWLDESKTHHATKSESKSERFTMLCMRSCFSYDSGLDLLSDAFEQLCRSGGDSELTIVGTIPEAVEPQVARLRTNPHVHFRPFVEHEELLRMIASCRVCVIPYRQTSDLSQIFPIKVLEYLSQGAVVVAPDLPGIAAMITSGDNGLLFQPGNSRDLAEKLRTVYADPPYAARIAARAMRLGEEFDCRKKAEVILGALQKLCWREQREAAGALTEA